MTTPRSTSIQARLLNYSRERRANHSHTLVRYGIERLMYRLSRSPHADRFVLKGAMLFVLWLEDSGLVRLFPVSCLPLDSHD